MPAIRDFSQGYHATTTYRHVEAPMCDYAAGDLLLGIVTIDDSAGVTAQTVKGGRPVPYVFYNDDTAGTPAWTDYTVQANDATAGDWFMSPTIPSVNDCIYFGSLEQFNQVNILNSVAGVASVNTVWALEYYNGAVWGVLTTTTDTVGPNLEFVATVHAEAIWTPPANWATVAINGVTAYWVRWRCTTSSTFGTRPVSTQAWIFPVANSNNCWRQLISYYAGNTPSPLSVVWKIAGADEVDTTFFYATAETANVELISIKDVQITADSGAAALTVNVTAASGTFVRTTGSWVTDGFAVGMQVQPSGFTNAANNYIRQISSISTTSNANDTITVTDITGLVNESGNANERLLAYPFNSNISGGGTGSTFDGYTTSCFIVTNTTVTTNVLTVSSTNGLVVNDPIIFYATVFGNIVAGTIYYIQSIVNATTFKISATIGGGEFALVTASGSMSASFFRQAMPTLTTTKNDCLLVWASNKDAVSVPSIIDGACQLIAGKDGSAHSDGCAWGYQKYSGITPTVYTISMTNIMGIMAVIAVNPPHGGATVVPTYTVSDASVYISPFTGAAWKTDTLPDNTVTTTFTGKVNGKPLVVGGTTVTRADTGINSYHAMCNFTGVVTAGSYAGIRGIIASRSIAGKNLLFHIQPYLPVDIQTTDSVALSGTCGVGIGLASAAGVGKIWHVGGNGVYGDTQRHQPVVINTSATSGVLSHLGSFAVSGGSGTFVAATSRIYVGASWAAATKRGWITSVSGTTPTQTIVYTTLAGYPDFAASDSIVEYTAANANGATGTAGTVTSLNGAAVTTIGLMVSGKVVAPNWMVGSIWTLDTYVVAGGNTTTPVTLPKIIAAYAQGHERRSAIQQGSGQGLFLGPIQLGDGGTNVINLDLSNTAIEFPGQYSKSLKEVFYNSIDNYCGLTYYASSSDVINHSDAVVSSRSKYAWGFHASTTTSAVYNLNGLQVIGAGTVTLKSGLPLTGVTWSKCDTIASIGAVLDSCTFNASVGTNALTLASVAESNSVDRCRFTSNSRAIKITTAGTYTFDGHTFTGNTYDIENSSAGAVIVNNINGSNASTYINTGGGSTSINNPVTVSVTCFNAKTLATIQSARVLLKAASGGPLPYNASISITRASSTATVTHTSHGMRDGQKIVVKGAVQKEYNGIFTITYISSSSYSYTVTGTPATPATGTILCTGVILDGSTDANGVIQDTAYNYISPQSVAGQARKSSAAPLYQTSSLVGTITNVGAALSTFLVPD